MSSRLPALPSVAVPAENVPTIEASYKAREVEGFLDIHFYRKIGFRLALLFAKLGMTPAQVTLCGAAAGIMAGHFYYYRDLKLNLLGMVLHVLSNALDNADGQLARLTRQGSRSGRALDGLADHLVFVSIYGHLCLRYTAGGGSQLVWLLALAAGVSHSLQSAAADYFRNAWLYFAEGKSRAELDSSPGLRLEYDRLGWRTAPRKKFLLRLYLNYTRQQEWLAPRMGELEQAARKTNDGVVAKAYLQGKQIDAPMAQPPRHQSTHDSAFRIPPLGSAGLVFFCGTDRFQSSPSPSSSPRRCGLPSSSGPPLEGGPHPSLDSPLIEPRNSGIVSPMPQRYVSNKNESVRMFESDFMELFSHVHPVTPLVIYLPLMGYMLYVAAALRALPLGVILGLVAVGVLIWSLVESHDAPLDFSL